MATINSLLRKVQRLNIDSVIQHSFEKTKVDLADHNKEQLEAGFTKTGQRLRPYKNKSYAKRKNILNPLPGLGNPDLKVTGSFHRGIKAAILGNSIRITSSDKKAKWLIPRYENIFGLGGEYKRRFIKSKLRPVFLARIRKAVGL